MRHETLEVTRDARDVVSVTLNRPEKRNALSARMIAELTDVAAALNARPDTRAVVLRGAGKVFCAGGDLSWMMAQIEADRDTRMAEARKLAMMLHALNTLRAPLIGLVHGVAMGGGVGMAAVCDSVVAIEGTRFAFTETRLGLIPATISPYVLARMGEGAARRVFMSSRVFGADEAAQLGLVSRSVPPEEAEAALAEEVAPYLDVAPGAVGRAKALARALGPRIDEETIDLSIRALADAWETDEARDGVAAFLDKSTPPWSRDG